MKYECIRKDVLMENKLSFLEWFDKSELIKNYINYWVSCGWEDCEGFREKL